MNELLANLTNRWNALPPRTRVLAVAGTIVVGFALVYAAVWMPLQKDLKRLRASVPGAAAQLQWMRNQAPLARAARARAVTSSGSITSAIEQSAASHGVRTFVSRIEQEGNAGARVTLDAVPFNTLVTWAADLQATHGAVIEDATIDAHQTPGLVNARLRLRSAGS